MIKKYATQESKEKSLKEMGQTTSKNMLLCFWALHYLSAFFKLIFIGVQLIYNVELVSAIQQSESFIHTDVSTIFRFYSHIGHYRILSRVPCAIQ